MSTEVTKEYLAYLDSLHVSILLGPGIDGRKGMTATFDGLPLDTEPVNLKLLSVQPYDNGAQWCCLASVCSALIVLQVNRKFT